MPIAVFFRNLFSAMRVDPRRGEISPGQCDMCDTRVRAFAAALLALLVAPPAEARDSLGVFSAWGAFRDSAVPLCYAIAKPQPTTRSREHEPYADVATWPRKGLRNQVHFRLARTIAKGSGVTLYLGGERFALVAGGSDAWAADRRMDAAVVAAMRSADSMTVWARDARGRRFSNTYRLIGAASAMDAAALGCAQLR
jgi:hypothetical protein